MVSVRDDEARWQAVEAEIEAKNAAWQARQEQLREQAEARGFAWAYWEFGAGFGVYNREIGQWREALLRALIP